MSFPFPKTRPNKLGYKPEDVDAFIERARVEFNERHDGHELGIREHEFELVKGGYSVSAVDAALDRLEDSFAKRYYQAQVEALGHEGLLERANHIRVLLVGRMERPAGKKFSSTGFILRGYSKKQVDEFLNLVSTHIETRSNLSLDAVRKVLFTAKRGGYAENQVDAFIDKVIELLQIEQVL